MGSKPLIYVVTSDEFLPSGTSEEDRRTIKKIVGRCCEGGAKIFQYRAKKLPSKVQFWQALWACEECRERKMIFIVDDRVDIALAVGADGVHLGQDDVPPEKARDFFDGIIGFSTHNTAQAKLAQNLPLSYISIGPVFATRTKENPDPTVGVETVREVVSISRFPVVAIGGINNGNARQVAKCGVWAIAVVSYVFEAGVENIAERIKKLLKSLT